MADVIDDTLSIVWPRSGSGGRAISGAMTELALNTLTQRLDRLERRMVVEMLEMKPEQLA